jgi:hypothetical protein
MAMNLFVRLFYVHHNFRNAAFQNNFQPQRSCAVVYAPEGKYFLRSPARLWLVLCAAAMKNRTMLILLIVLPVLAASWAWLRPRDAQFYFDRGVERFEYEDEDGNGRNIDGALAGFNRVIRLNPKFSAAYRRRGQIVEVNGDPCPTGRQGCAPPSRFAG